MMKLLLLFSTVILLVPKIKTENSTGLENESPGNATAEPKINFNRYYRYKQITKSLRQMQKSNKKIMKLAVIGRTAQKRKIYAVVVSGNGFKRTRPVIFVDAGIHAREWIGTSAALYLIQQLVNRKNKFLYQNIDWYIVPLVNPDGYEYTHVKNRNWRKNRSKGKRCFGVDLNRNFGFKWGKKGSTKNQCKATYRGRKPFSEPETRAIRNLARRVNKKIKLYLTLHSHGQLILHPWGFTKKSIRDRKSLVRVATMAAKAIKSATGTTYRIGSVATKLRMNSGSSRDYFYGKLGVKYSYTVELPPTKKRKGYILPPKQIRKAVRGVFVGIKSFWRQIKKIYIKKQEEQPTV